MKHIRPISGTIKALDWGLNSNLGGITAIIQAIISLLNAIGLIKDTGSDSTDETTNEATE
jgi:uncharacterized membrane protein